MKRLYRGLMILFCVALWLGLRVAAADIAQSARVAPYREPFLFPDFLQGTDIYVWSLSSGEAGAQLVVQNIGDRVLSNIEISFLSYGEKLIFAAKQMRPGEKLCLYEVSGSVYDGESPVICAGVLADTGDF